MLASQFVHIVKGFIDMQGWYLKISRPILLHDDDITVEHIFMRD